MPTYPERAFLPHDVLAEIVRGTLQPLFPDVFSPEHLQPVGIDIAGREIIDVHGNKVEPQNGRYSLPQGTYRVHFGFEVSSVFRGKVEPLIHWRTSNHRCGVLGSQCFALDRDHPDEPVNLFDGEIVGNYHVLNPYGVTIEEGARLAQLSFTTGYAPPLRVTDMQTPYHIEIFSGQGIIGRDKTIMPRLKALPDEQTSSGRGWQLTRNTPYLVTLMGNVAVASNEVMLTTIRVADLALYPHTGWLFISTALGDPGFHGTLSMLVQPAWDLKLSENDGLCRFTSIPILPIGDQRQYQGQWAGDAGEPLALRSLEEAGLIGVTAPPLEELVKRVFGR